MTVSTRFAPSPTGLLHIGNLRAALFNYLFTRKNGGSFMLRMDDTDIERSTEEFAQAIQRDLTWLGISWDSYGRQTDRTARHLEELERLKKIGRVYPCFETTEEIELKRKIQLGRRLPPIYDRAALKLTPAEIEKLIASGRKPHWRFKLDDGFSEWDDLIEGHKKIPLSSTSDPIVVRENGSVLYNFSSVVDDVDLGITHIFRGADHITNTATQVAMFKAISDKPLPSFGHFPLIVSADGTEMSKRLGTFSLQQMREDWGIEPMALCSLMAKLGTSENVVPYVTMDQLVESFDVKTVSHSTAKFDPEDIKTLTAKIMHATPFAMVKERLAKIGLDALDEAFWNVARHNIGKFSDIQHWWRVVHGPVTPVIEDAAFLAEASALFPSDALDETSWSTWTKAIKEKTGKSGKALFHPLRLALTGEENGPEMKHLLPLIGAERAKSRLAGIQR